MPLTPQALEIFLSNDKNLDKALTYVFNFGVDKDEAVYWHELSDARNIYDEFASFVTQNNEDVELNEAEMQEILQENHAVFARWLRKDMLLEYATTLLADTERYSLDNLADEPYPDLDGKSPRQIITQALAQRK